MYHSQICSQDAGCAGLAVWPRPLSQRIGFVLSGCSGHMPGGSPREGGYTFKKLDESSGLLLDGGEEVAS